MAGKLNYGPRFQNGHVESMGGNAPVKGPVQQNYWWWNAQRTAKLEYIMAKYNDLEKAARVFGCPVWCIAKRLRHLRYENIMALKKHETQA